MAINNSVVCCRVLDEGVNDIQNSFWMDAPVKKVYELLDKEFESTISNNLISL